MSIHFNADEVFEMAERMEQNASTYYHKAAEKVDYPGARQMFLELSSWEEKHERTFGELRKSLAPADKEETTFDPYNESLQYLHALADESVYDNSRDPLADIGGAPSFASILRFALSKEKDSIAFYLGMKELVPGQLGKDQIDKIIREEMGHVTMLTDKIRKVSK
jgi:rubrerythrin